MRMPGGEGYVYYNDIHLYWKSDANHEIEEWMCRMRGHPVLKSRVSGDREYNYQQRQRIVWEFTSTIRRIGSLEDEWVSPEDHAYENAMARGVTRII